jgi:hypothetical protein
VLEQNLMRVDKAYLAHEFVRLTQREQLRPPDDTLTIKVPTTP